MSKPPHHNSTFWPYQPSPSPSSMTPFHNTFGIQHPSWQDPMMGKMLLSQSFFFTHNFRQSSLALTVPQDVRKNKMSYFHCPSTLLSAGNCKSRLQCLNVLKSISVAHSLSSSPLGVVGDSSQNGSPGGGILENGSA